MSRLIDADKLTKEIENTYDLNYGEILINPTEFIELIDKQQTVDVPLIIHSHWNENTNHMWEQTGYWECASCKGLSMKFSKFCPHCGAKMDDTTI